MGIILDNTRSVITRTIGVDVKFLQDFGSDEAAIRYLEFIKKHVERRIDLIKSGEANE